MLKRLNDMLAGPPKYGPGYIPFPLGTILIWPMCTEAGLGTFRNAEVSSHLGNILKAWAAFLSTGESRSTLNNGTYGWLKEEVLGRDFCDTYVCDPREEYWGFKSWDDFFTRPLRPGKRPIDAPNNASVVVSGADSTPLRIARNVKETDEFWVKGEPYSLRDMLNNDPRTPQFANGTVYQAFLAALNYHRWHSPVNGTVVSVETVQGTYCALSPSIGFNATEHPDPPAEEFSQIFMTNVATRSIVLIEADNKDIGLMAFIAVGMIEISSCEPTVNVGDRVNKGDQLGMFHYGGSTHVLIFRPEVDIEFIEGMEDAIRDGTVILLGKEIAVVKPQTA